MLPSLEAIALDAWPSIQCLFLRRSPPAVTRLIVSIIVDAIEGQAQWFRSHISEEVFKLQPSLTDCNASATVVFECSLAGIGAAANHSGPSVIFRRVQTLFGMTVFSVGWLILLKTATTTSIASAKCVAAEKFMAAAIAKTQPQNQLNLSPASLAEDDKSSESLANKVNLWGHRGILSVSGSRAAATVAAASILTESGFA